MTVSQDTIEDQYSVILPSQARERLLILTEELLPKENRVIKEGETRSQVFVYGDTDVYFSSNKDLWFRSQNESLDFIIKSEGYSNNIVTVEFCKGISSQSTVWILPQQEIMEFRDGKYKTYQDFVAAHPLFDFLSLLENLKTQPKTEI